MHPPVWLHLGRKVSILVVIGFLLKILGLGHHGGEGGVVGALHIFSFRARKVLGVIFSLLSVPL